MYSVLRLFFGLMLFVCAAHSVMAQEVVSIDSFEKSRGFKVVRHLLIEGNKLTKRNIITRELSITEGDTLAALGVKDVLLLNKQRLLNLPLFTSVQVTDSAVGGAYIDVHIKVKERWYLMPEVSFKLADRNFNVWWQEQNHQLRRTNIGCEIKHSNVWGNMVEMGVILQGGYTQKFGLLYARPYIDARQQHGVGGQVVYSQSQEMPFATTNNKLAFARHEQVYINRNYEGTLSYSYRPEYALKHLFQLSYRQYSIADTIFALNPNYFLNQSKRLAYVELSYRLDLNQSDNWNYALKGEKLIATLTQRLGWQGMKTQTQLFAEAMWMREFAPKWYSSFVIKGRLSFPQQQPYLLMNALGYDTKYLRGYEYYVIDGSHFVMGRIALKRELWKHTFKNIPVRYLPELPIRLYPKIYTDAGYCYNKYPGNSSLNNKLLGSVGFGLDIVTAYDVKIKLEYSINHLGQHGFYFHQHGD